MTNALVWFRKDLRLEDNSAFIEACTQHAHVLPIYIIDETVFLGKAQKWWLSQSLKKLDASLKSLGLSLIVRKGHCQTILEALIQKHALTHVYWNRCYDPISIERDKKIKSCLRAQNIQASTSNAFLLQEPWDIQTQKGTPFKIFSSFLKAFSQSMRLSAARSRLHTPRLIEESNDPLAWAFLEEGQIEFSSEFSSDFSFYWNPGEEGALRAWSDFLAQGLEHYKEKRDMPSANGTSRLSAHLCFGEISVAQMWRDLSEMRDEHPHLSASIEVFQSELVWREFSYHTFYDQPNFTCENIRKTFDTFPWSKQDQDPKYTAWQQGKTGFPIIDAGMRELLHTGFMHNRVRMIVASFLTKNLLVDWRVGAQWFLERLVDADLANNSMNWQWVAGTGFDSSPFFRIFNPTLQAQKFDPKGDYIRRWVKELVDVPPEAIHEPWSQKAKIGHLDYTLPIVNYAQTRKKALEMYHSSSKEEKFKEDDA